MSGPLIPYITLPEIPLDFLLHVPGISSLLDPQHPPSIKPFGTLVALGVYLGSVVAVRHAKERRLDLKKMNDFIFWVVAAGFVGGHVLDAIFYHPETVARDPLYLLKLWDGLSSFGGFTGAMIGGVSWKLVKGERILPYTDTVASAFPLAWVFGRAGCSVAHDHPGALSDAWFAVQYPMGRGYIGRFDLGLYEMLLTIPMAVTFAILWRRAPRPYGFFVGWMCALYAPVRFVLDFFRAADDGAVAGADPRYAGLTPAQWACFGLLGLGWYLVDLSKRPENQLDAPVNRPADDAKTEEVGTNSEAPRAEATTESPSSGEIAAPPADDVAPSEPR